MNVVTVPDKQQCVTRDLLARNAKQWPDLVVVKFDSGDSFTTTELLQHVIIHAASLQALGIKQDDYVLTWLPNGPLAVTMLLALNYIGAIYVPINTAYRGGLLEHVIANSQAKAMIADSRLLDRLELIDTAQLETLVMVGVSNEQDCQRFIDKNAQLNNIRCLPEYALCRSDVLLQPLKREPQPYDTHMVIFTSGTTGPSKGVLSSYIHTYVTAIEFRHVGPGDCSLVSLPMFHIGGVLGLYFALIHGGCAAMVESFKTKTFWHTVKQMEVTTVGLLGAMVQFLMQQPKTHNERNHGVKTAVIAPLGEDALAFADRFGIDVYTEFNMTELSVPLYCGPNPQVRGTCGQPRPGVELRIVDKNDLPVTQGNTGELIVRTVMPWSMSHGYLNNPQATAEAWRNGWFHTGDLFYCDGDDNYFFVDRVKDMIRRRGENISSFEVEAEIIAHPLVKEVAIVAVPGDGGEDEVLAVVASIDGAEINPEQLLMFLQPRLAHYMIPRYLRILDALPKTPTQKIEKHVLRTAGLTETTWDREQAGIKIKRQNLSNNKAL